ncbi:MAG: LPS export ABC transporter permease LptG [Pseudomonadales bacterium]|nr:LPS export ABC transporter permease LptG [Pseudomonadales bacterium]
MTLFDRYISVSFIGGCIPVLLLLLSLFSFLALAEELEDVGKGAYHLADALQVVIYTLPARLVDLFPITVLLGGLLGLGALANHAELISMRAAAISPARLALPLFRLALVLIGLVFCLQIWVIPFVEHKATLLRSKTLVEQDKAHADDLSGSESKREFWTRNNKQFIRIGSVQADRSLSGVEIYQFDEQGNLMQLVQTSTAELLKDNTWLLHKVRQTQLAEGQSKTDLSDTLIWDALLSKQQTKTLITPANSLAPTDLWRFIQRLENNNMNSESHRIMFWTQMSIPVGLLGMALLTLPFLLGSVRSVTTGQRIAMGGLLGITYYLVQQISGHVAGILGWNAGLTVMMPGLLILLTAVVLIRRAN